MRAADEESRVKEEEREIRRLAREHCLPVIDVENVHDVFKSFDTDDSGEIEFQEFGQVLRKLMKIPGHQELPETRTRKFWKEE